MERNVEKITIIYFYYLFYLLYIINLFVQICSEVNKMAAWVQFTGHMFEEVLRLRPQILDLCPECLALGNFVALVEF